MDILILVVILLVFFNRRKAKSREQSGIRETRRTVRQANPKREKIRSSDLKRQYRESAHGSIAQFRKLEDRENDWLARQIREESKWKRNSCFDPAAELKRSHEKDCDARALAKEHAKAHRLGRI